jgi:hypothetical protein
VNIADAEPSAPRCNEARHGRFCLDEARAATRCRLPLAVVVAGPSSRWAGLVPRSDARIAR